MNHVTTKVAAVTVAFASLLGLSAAVAADLGSQVAEPAGAPPTTIARQFYVRGDLGIGRYTHGDFSQADLAGNGGSIVSQSIGTSVSIGAGVGWQVTSHLRFDLTGEYRAKASISAMDDLSGDLLVPAGTLQANTVYSGRLSALVGLVNGYWDITTWNGITPYVGAGVGLVRLHVSDFTTSSTATFTDAATGDQLVQQSTGYSDSHSQINLAWALMAGASFDLRPDLKLDVGYRYLNLGSGISAQTALLNCLCRTIGEPMKIADLDAHEVRIGIRWQLSEPRQVSHEPLK